MTFDNIKRSVLGNMILRMTTGELRKEDLNILYNAELKPRTLIEKGEYRGFKYVIRSNGRYPVINIETTSVMSAFSGQSKILMPDRTGKKIEVLRGFSPDSCMFNHTYAYPGDYVKIIDGTYTPETVDKKAAKDGHKYTVDELKSDIRSIVDYIIKSESEFIKKT